jgi:alcohol oxidase
MKFYRGEVLSNHPVFPKGSAAETRSSGMPVDVTAPDIVYTTEDDEAIDKYNRENGELFLNMYISGLNFYTFSAATAWHSVSLMASQYSTLVQHSFAVRYLCHEAPRPGRSR